MAKKLSVESLSHPTARLGQCQSMSTASRNSPAPSWTIASCFCCLKKKRVNMQFAILHPKPQHLIRGGSSIAALGCAAKSRHYYHFFVTHLYSAALPAARQKSQLFTLQISSNGLTTQVNLMSNQVNSWFTRCWCISLARFTF